MSFLKAEWRKLALANYAVEEQTLLPYLPPKTELDPWNGTHYASLVGFMFKNVRLLGLKIPFHVHFEEVNLRFYVRRKGPEGWRRGVVFVKELVPKTAIAAVARGVYNEKYDALPMRHTLERSTTAGAPYIMAQYDWQVDNRWNYLRVKTTGAVQPIVDGSEEEFIAEHYWGYSMQPGGGCVEYQVEHPRWQIWQVRESELLCDVAVLYGPQFVEPLDASPSSAFLAQGSAVTVRRGVRI